MKILLATDTFYPMINGVVISTANLYKQLKNSGHDVRILTLSSTGEEKVIGDIYYTKSFRINVYPDARVANPFSKKLIDEIIQWKPDIVHSQTEFSAFLISKRIANHACIPHIHTYHTMYEDYLHYILGSKFLTKRSLGRLVKSILDSSDGIIVPTEKVKNCLLNYGVTNSIYVIPTGIEINKFRNKISQKEKTEILSKYNIHDNNVLIYIGRVAKEKNIEEIINYFSYLNKEMESVKLLIVGGGPYLENLKKLVNDLKLQHIIKFTGMVPQNEVYKYYQLGKAFVTASKSETQGLTYIEALASGTPVICRYDPCIEGLIIDGQTGFTYKNKSEFIKHVKDIFFNNELSYNLSSNALKKAEDYSCETFGEQINKVYLETLSKFAYEKKRSILSFRFKMPN
jgi:1,2-diacylglycerol 3-alpha-glucosyltransferase